MAETLALLIGPSYPADLPTYCGPLQGVANDLKLMKDMLCENGFQPENIKVLEGLLASRASILASLEELSERAQKGSVVVVYYCGHGHSFDPKQAGYFDEGLIPGDLTREMVDEYHILDTCITGEHFSPHLSKLINKGALVNVIFDCCFSGHMYRGNSEVKNTYTGIKQLALSDEYISEYQKVLKARGYPTEHEEEHSPVQETQLSSTVTQETQPANPASAPVALPYPVSEFWTPALKSEGWSPHENDNFIFMGACATNEKAYEFMDHELGEIHGMFTSALVAVIKESPPGQRLSYNMLKSLVRQRMADRKQRQTPQFEGGNMNLILFSFDKAPPPPISFEVKEVHEKREFTYRITLNAGFLQGVVEGVYYIFDTRLTDENQMEDFRMATVNVSHENIHATESTAEVEINSIFHECKVKVGYKARLAKLGSMFYPICIIATELEEKYIWELKLAILMDSLQMFSLREQETPECVKMDVVTIEKKKCWRAIYKGRMIAPDQRVEDGHLMIKNLCKYFRVKFGTRLRDPGHNMLRNVSLKLFKVENVPSYKKNLTKKKELKAQAVQTAEVYEGHPEDYVPNFGAHKVEIAPNSGFRRKYDVVDSSGDAVVIQITNNEEFPIHVCLISYQSDGSIVALYPAAKKGLTSVLRPGESVSEIRRVFLQPETFRLMEEPNDELRRPDGCNDIIMLYATTAEADYLPLFQTSIELSPYLSTRGIDTPDGLGLFTVARFRDALDSEPRSRDVAREDVRWITIKREFRVLYHPEQTFEKIDPLEE
ncbi:unnamed protein product [Pocillopora meandrina]|uniref:Peptidase C14 caspase domain-containing protein n=1 Tax=Pocillopora meandrina TaxID=46732 RepID=A0AAU9WK86_9CNID|nr:unnamed protein product [Pocillopora meandrina]